MNILKVWVRSGDALRSEIPLPSHPHDPSQIILYGAEVHSEYMPVSVNTGTLLQWLYYRGVPFLKGT